MLVCSYILLVKILIDTVSRILLGGTTVGRCRGRLGRCLGPVMVFTCTVFIKAAFLSVVTCHKVPLSVKPVLRTADCVCIAVFKIGVFRRELGGGGVVTLFFVMNKVVVCSMFKWVDG